MPSLLSSISDHPVRHILQNTINYLPLSEQVQMLRSTTGAMNDPKLMAKWAKQIVKIAQVNDLELENANAVEIGAGHSLGIAALLLLKNVAKVTAIDVKAYADPSNLDQFLPIIEKGQEIGLLSKAEDVTPSKIEQGLQYSLVKSDGSWDLPAESADLVYSFYSGEHWRSVDQVLAEAYRALTPGGLCIHTIDLRDHYHFHKNWLQFLYYEEWLWEAMSSKRGRWSNRLLSPQWHEKFQKDFDILLFKSFRQSLPDGFDVNKLAAPFQKYDSDVLSVFEVLVVARKPFA